MQWPTQASLLKGFKSIVIPQPQALAQTESPDTTALQTILAIKQDPANIMARAGMPPDPWQARMLRSKSNRILLNCSRQVGKSQTTAGLALKTALLKNDANVLILSKSEAQSGEMFRRKLLPLWRKLGRPYMAKPPSSLCIEFSNGSRILALPSTPDTIVGYSAIDLLIIDEAGRVSDNLYYDVLPMTAVVDGAVVLLSSPFGKRGFFWQEWSENKDSWECYEVPAANCPRLKPAYLRQMKKSMGERWYRQNFCCSFEDVVGALFSGEEIDALFNVDFDPLWGDDE